MRYLFILSAFLFLLASCDEIAPVIPDPPEGGDRVVLLEEFSGGSCVPCADAAAIVADISAQYGENFVPLTIHTFLGGTADPYPGSKYDFRTEDGQEILEFLGLPLGIPSGVINRKLHEGQSEFQAPKSKWNGIVQQAVEDEPGVNIGLNISYDPATRELEVLANIIPLSNISGDIRLLVVLAESHLIDKQAAPTGVVDDFEHNHILRDVITPTIGESLGNSLSNQVPVSSTVTFTVPPEENDWWVEGNLEVVAFVVNNQGDSKEVLQAASAHLVE